MSSQNGTKASSHPLFPRDKVGSANHESKVPEPASRNDTATTESWHIPTSGPGAIEIHPEDLDRGLSSIFQSRPKVSRAVADKLAEDDAAIKALERALGIKGKQGGQKYTDEDGLRELLGDFGDSEDEQTISKKRSASEDGMWLKQKRKKAKIQSDVPPSRSPSLDPNFDDWDGDDLDAVGSVRDASSQLDGSDEEADFDLENGHVNKAPSGVVPKGRRENPYLPGGQHTNDDFPKYVPPSRRIKDLSHDESISMLKRLVQGVLNRLSESNMISIVGEVEKIYHQNPRQHVTSLLLDSLYGLLCDPSPLQDTFMILHGGFVAALHREIGHDFGAQCIERFVEEFTSVTLKLGRLESIGKEASNLIAFLTELYNFQVIGSNLIYDYIRLFVTDISEEHTELLLRIVKCMSQRFDAMTLKLISYSKR